MATFDMNNYKEALPFFEQALKIKREIGDLNGEAICLDNLGKTYEKLGDSTKATDYLFESVLMNLEIGNKKNANFTLRSKGEFYYNKKNYLKAIDYYKNALEIAQEINVNDDLLALYKDLSNSYVAIYDFESAHNYDSLYIALSDSMHKQEATEMLNYLSNNQKSILNSTDINSMADNKSNNNTSKGMIVLGYSCFILLSGFMLALFFYFKERKINKFAQNKKS